MKELCKGVRQSESGESWTNWWLFPKMTDEEADNMIEELGLDSSFSGVGSTYVDEGYYRHGRQWTLIKQNGGWDI